MRQRDGSIVVLCFALLSGFLALAFGSLPGLLSFTFGSLVRCLSFPFVGLCPFLLFFADALGTLLRLFAFALPALGALSIRFHVWLPTRSCHQRTRPDQGVGSSLAATDARPWCSPDVGTLRATGASKQDIRKEHS